MTLIICMLAALITSVFWYRRQANSAQSSPAKSLNWGSLSLAYWGASLMWSVDGIANLVAGEPFVELANPFVMADDAMLGFVVVGAGLVLWAGAARIKARRLSA